MLPARNGSPPGLLFSHRRGVDLGLIGSMRVYNTQDYCEVLNELLRCSPSADFHYSSTNTLLYNLAMQPFRPIQIIVALAVLATSVVTAPVPQS